jgi:uncharacterized protein (TIGR02117 family)
MARRRPPPGRRRLPILALAFAALALLVALTSRPRDPSLYPPVIGAPRTTIYLIDNGFHSDLALPRAALAADPLLARALAMTSDKPWILVGWGDARFYTASGFSAARGADALRALFGTHNPSVVHLEGIASQPDTAFVDATSREIEVSDAGLARMTARIDQAFARGPDGGPERAAGVVGADEAFFRGAEAFNLTHLCNHWTAQVLNAAGLPVSLALDTLPAGLRLDLALSARISGGSVPGTALPAGGRPGRAGSID